MAQPHPDGYDVDEAEEAGRGLVVARSHPRGVLEAVEAPLHKVSQGVDARVDGDELLSVPAHGDDRQNVPLQQGFPNGIRVITLVGNQHTGAGRFSAMARSKPE